MHLTVKEMEALCVFHAGTLAGTLELIRSAVSPSSGPEVLISLAEKLAQMNDGENCYITFD